MPDYYFSSYDTSSKLTLKNGAKYLNTVDGTFRGVAASNLQTSLSLIHKVQSDEVDRFLAYYATNKNSQLIVGYGGIDYTMKFKSKPITIPLGADMWKISVSLVGVA